MAERGGVAEQAREERKEQVLVCLDALYEEGIIDRYNQECLDIGNQFEHDRLLLQRQFEREASQMAEAHALRREEMARTIERQRRRATECASAYLGVLEKAIPLVQEEFSVSWGDANQYLSEWVRVFGERQRRLAVSTAQEGEETGGSPHEEQVFACLDALRGEGSVNMFEVAPHIQEEFDMTRRTAARYLIKWMRSYGKRHPTVGGVQSKEGE